MRWGFLDLLYKLEEYTLQYVLAWICCRQAATHAPVLKPAVCLHNVAAVAAGAGATVSEAPGAFQPGAASGRQHGMCMQMDNDHLPRQAWDTHISEGQRLKGEPFRFRFRFDIDFVCAHT